MSRVKQLLTATAVLLTVFTCGYMTFLLKLQMFTISNETLTAITVPKVKLACDELDVGVLAPAGSRTVIFRRTCDTEASYVIIGVQADGTPLRGEACYIDKFPDNSRLRITESEPQITCDGHGILDALRRIWR